MSSVSLARSGRRIWLGPVASAEMTNARAVMDFEPGSRMVPETGLGALGAVHKVWVTTTVCRVPWPVCAVGVR